MARETWTFEELFGGMDAAPSFVAELERLGLLQVVARDGQGAPLYAPEARDQLDKVLALVELGYQPRDIAAIARKVGLPAQKRGLFRKRPIFIRIAELARRSEVDPVTVETWRETGLLVPAMVSEGGEPLFPVSSVALVRSLQDLVAFGCEEDELVAWAQLERALRQAMEAAKGRDGGDAPGDEARARAEAIVIEAQQVMTGLARRLDQLRLGIRRWDKLLGATAKRLDRLRRLHDIEVAKPRRRRRRHVRSRARGRKLDAE